MSTVPKGWTSVDTSVEPLLFCVRYRDGYIATALIEAKNWQDVERAFYAQGYKGRILSFKLAD